LGSKDIYNIKLGVQQSEADPNNPIATNLNDSIFSLAEVEVIAVPFGLGEGHYGYGAGSITAHGQDRTGWGVSIDQHLTPEVTVFGRYGNGDVGGTRVHFFDAGFGFQAPFAFNPLDRWGIGYARPSLCSGDELTQESWSKASIICTDGSPRSVGHASNMWWSQASALTFSFPVFGWA
jgi:hypothetical protein